MHIIYKYNIFSIHSSINEYLYCFYVLDVGQSAAMNMGVQISFPDIVFIYLGY